MQQAKEYFDKNDRVDKLYFTSDNLAFFEEQNAINHAKRLDDATITAKTKEQVELELEAITNDNWEDELKYDPLDELDAE